ncbi:hypothetical protein RB619_13425 [Flavobacterium sp. LHD-80]|uniref:hypothetical protein n=1 Tax=Flavobacterium sp. LHD-80 TaxID=3071411 RepID=UPI0027E08625|nr:hypothetical protein [Flavobacterium sp. LHD-80]MDQ6471651.1 hypothetical protein [Flavobacterium sp. LHD-80]
MKIEPTIKIIGDIIITQEKENIINFFNKKNDAYFGLYGDGIQYTDPFGNTMLNHRTAISVDGKSYSLKKVCDEIRRKDGSIIILLTTKEIQEIANKTFYEEEQVRPVDFLTFTIIEE